MMLHKLLSRLDRYEFESQVVSLLDRGAMGERIEPLGIRVRVLEMPRGPRALVGILRLVRWLRENPVDIIQCWMYHADLVGGLAGRLAGVRRVIWGIRQSTIDPRGTKRSTLWIAKTCARLSGFVPVRIVCCSQGARQGHAALGYDAAKMVVIPNGFDVDAFRPDPARGGEVRRELGIPEGAPLVGLVARFHPQKDHRTFLAAARRVGERFPNAHFLLCGEGIDSGNATLSGWVRAFGLGERVHLLGERGDVPRLTAALDVACSTSFAEGFPNAVGEAMACGVPCVVTDVGDSAELVGDTGRVVPPEKPNALADGVIELLTAGPEGRRRLAEAARTRVAERYSLPAVVERYQDLYREVLST